jgi:hypothetical protein
VPFYRALSEPEQDRLTAGLALAARLVDAENAPNVIELQALYDTLLQDANRSAAAVEALGYAFGNLFLQHDWLLWAMMLDNEFGDEAAVVVRDRKLGCSPLSMIRNRLQDEESCDLADLVATTVSRLRQLGQQAASVGK